MSLEILNYSNILIELNKAVKMHNFYPEGHPNYESALENCYAILRKSIDEQGEINWTVDQKGFYSNKNPIAPATQEIAGFAKKIFFRRIKEISFTSGLSLVDLKAFMAMLKLEPEELQAKGGVEAFLAERDITGILLNALKYEDIKKLKKELEEKKEKEKAEIAEKKKEEEAGESSESGEKEQKPPQPPEDQAPLPELLERIKKEKDFLRYSDLSVKIKERSDAMLLEKKFSDILPALIVFTEHSHHSSDLPEDIKAAASERLRSLLNRDMIQFLVRKVGGKDEPLRASFQHMLLSAGPETVEFLLDAIIEAPEAITRRHLFNTLSLFGSSIRKRVEARLDSSEWYAIRQMVSLLGELGDPASIDAIDAAYKNTADIRVKKEVLKTLVKLASSRSTEILIRIIEEDRVLINQAIISLGLLKDPSAIDVLGRIACKREPFSDEQDTKREAIKALGIIGHPRSVPYLTRVLFKKTWFRRRANEEFRSLAAYSLGMIGGSEALEALQKAYSRSDGELYVACKRILEGKERNS